jgi:predicted RNase H-like HicB family nuclease
MTPRQTATRTAQLEAAFARIQAALDEIVEKEQQNGEHNERRSNGTTDAHPAGGTARAADGDCFSSD